MGYTESDLPIVLEDVIEGAEEKKGGKLKRSTLLGILLGNLLVGAVLASLLSGNPAQGKPEARANIDHDPRVGEELTEEQNEPPAEGLALENHDVTRRQIRKRRISQQVEQGRHRPSELALRHHLNPLIHVDLRPEIIRGSFVINVRARGPWSALDDDEVARNLEQIELTLKQNYPTDETSVTMVFDDGRPDLTSTGDAPAEDLARKIVQSHFRHISPRLYRSVDLQISCVDDGGGTDALRRKRGDVVQVDILVNAAAWDAEPTEQKVNVINDTTVFLAERYPEVTPYVTLNFDDGRESLPLKSSVDLRKLVRRS